MAGAALLASSTGHTFLTTAAMLLLGVCFGPIYPTAIAVTTTGFRHATGAATSIVMAIGSVGGMLLPWLQGVLMERSGLQSSVLLVVAAAVAMLVLYGVYSLLHDRQPVVVTQRLEQLPVGRHGIFLAGHGVRPHVCERAWTTPEEISKQIGDLRPWSAIRLAARGEELVLCGTAGRGNGRTTTGCFRLYESRVTAG